MKSAHPKSYNDATCNTFEHNYNSLRTPPPRRFKHSYDERELIAVMFKIILADCLAVVMHYHISIIIVVLIIACTHADTRTRAPCIYIDAAHCARYLHPTPCTPSSARTHTHLYKCIPRHPVDCVVRIKTQPCVHGITVRLTHPACLAVHVCASHAVVAPTTWTRTEKSPHECDSHR